MYVKSLCTLYESEARDNICQNILSWVGTCTSQLSRLKLAISRLQTQFTLIIDHYVARCTLLVLFCRLEVQKAKKQSLMKMKIIWKLLQIIVFLLVVIKIESKG